MLKMVMIVLVFVLKIFVYATKIAGYRNLKALFSVATVRYDRDAIARCTHDVTFRTAAALNAVSGVVR